jgi:hypothetical protein
MAARNPFASSIPDIYDPYGLAQPRRPTHSTTYYFLRNLLTVGAFAGGVVALYRNDVFLDLARRVGQEQRYLQAEKFLVGTPGWGTPRSMGPVLNPQGDSAAAQPATDSTVTSALATAAPSTPSGSDSPASTTTTPATTTASTTPPSPDTGTTAAATATAQLAAAPLTSPSPDAAPARTQRGSSSLAPVSFDSLPGNNRGGAVHTAAVEPAPARAVAPAPVHTAAPAPVAHAAAPRPAPVDHTRVKAIKVTLDETPEPATNRSVPLPTRAAAPPPEPKPAPAPKPVAAKPEPPKSKASDVHEGDNPLLAAVRGAVRTHPAKGAVPAAE